MMKSLRLLTGMAVLCLTVSKSASSQTFSPTGFAEGYNVFTQENLTTVAGTIQGPAAVGMDLVLQGPVVFAGTSSGTHPTHIANSTDNYGIALGRKVIYASGGLSTLSRGMIRLADGTGSRVWYTNASNVPSNVKLTSATAVYTATPALQASRTQAVGSATGSTDIDVADAFVEFNDYSARISSWKASTDPRLNRMTLAATSNPTITLLNDRINYLNLTSAQLSGVNGSLTFTNRPAANRILVVNVDISGSYTWTPPNTSGLIEADGAYIIWNFFSTTSLLINGNKAVPGTVYAPMASIDFTNNNSINGQVVARSFRMGNGILRYYIFNTTLPDVAEAIILPLRSINLRGSLVAHGAELLWDVLDEVEIADYSVQRSADGVNFVEAGVVRSSGDHARFTYRFTDGGADMRVQMLYYRILVREQNGNRFFSGVRSLRLNVGMNWHVWPNPVTDKVHVTFTSPDDGGAQFRVVNMTGQVLMRKQVATVSGTNGAELEGLRQLTPGSYFIELVDLKNKRIGIDRILR